MSADLSTRSKLAPWFWGLAALTPLLLAQTAFIRDNDLYWHLATGRWILENQQLPKVNTFSFTQPDYPWMNFEWLSQVAFFSVYKLLGWPGIYLIRALLLTGAGALLWRLGRQQKTAPGFTAGALGLGAALLWQRFSERPELFSWFFLSLFLSLLAPPHKPGKGQTAVLALAQIAWANTHGYFFLGPVIAGWRWLRGLLQAPAGERRWLEDLPLVLVLFAATLVNPFSWEIWTLPMKVSQSEVLGWIGEMRPPVWNGFKTTELWLALFALCPLVIGLLRKKRGWIADALLILPPLAMGFSHSRLFWLAGWLSLGLWQIALKKTRTHKFAPISQLPVAALLGLLIFWFLPKGPWFGEDRNGRPVKPLAFAAKHGWRGGVHTHFDDGGWLSFYFYPRFQPFIDGRFAYSESFFKTALDPSVTAVRPALHRYGAVLSVTPQGQSRLAHYAMFPADGQFQLYWMDRDHALLGKPPEKGALLPLRFLCPCSHPWGIPDYMNLLQNGPGRNLVEKELAELKKRSGQGSAFIEARWHLAAGRPEKALPLLTDPRDTLLRIAALAGAGDKKTGYRLFREVSSLLTGHTPAGASTIFPGAWELAWALDKKKQALHLVQKFLKERPRDLAALQWLAKHSPDAKTRSTARKTYNAAWKESLDFLELQLASRDINTALGFADLLYNIDPVSLRSHALYPRLRRATGLTLPEDLEPALISGAARPPPPPR